MISSFRKLVILRAMTEAVFVCLLVYSATLLSASSSVWLASGTACAFVWLRGRRVLVGVWLGIVIAYYFLTASIWLAMMTATIFACQTFYLSQINDRVTGPSSIFYRYTDYFIFLLCAALITAIANRALASVYDVAFTSSDWLANLNGLLAVAFPLVTLDAYFPQIGALKSTWRQLGWCAAMLSVFLFGIVFVLVPFSSNLPSVFLLIALTAYCIGVKSNGQLLCNQ